MSDQDRDDFKPRRPVVLVTGSGGFIGQALVEKLVADHDVVTFDHRVPDDPPKGNDPIEVDLSSDESVLEGLTQLRARHGRRIASVVHLASYFDLSGEPDPKYEEVTVRGTKRLFHGLKSFELEQFIFVSTLLVHAPVPHGQRIDENSPIDPKLPYRASKVRTEALLRDLHGDVPVVFARPAGVYSDDGGSAFLVHQIARVYQRLLTGRVYPGDPDTGQAYLHRDDLVEALLALIACRGALPLELPLLLAEDHAPSVRELNDEIGRLIDGDRMPMVEVPAAPAKLGVTIEATLLDVGPFIRPWMVDIASDHYAVDISRARDLLGWAPRHAVLQTLQTMIGRLKADPVGWYERNGMDGAVVADRAPVVLGTATPAPSDARRRLHAAALPHGTQPADGDAGGHGGHGAQGNDGGGGLVESHEGHGAHSDHGGHGGGSSHGDGMRAMHFKMLWAHWLNIMLGFWLLLSPFAFGLFDAQTFGEGVLRVTADRNLADPALRMTWLGWNDMASGALIVLFGALSLSPRTSWAQWANAAVGTWLLFAPLVFWAPTAAVYSNDTLIGVLVIAFAILVPMMPGMSMASMMDTSDVPVGWNYSPSTYVQRLPIIALGFVGFIIARQLTAYQLGHAAGVWDPFFGGQGALNGSETIITSEVSKAWPVPDGGLGAVSYLFEILMGVMGDRRRWRTMPWMVAGFGVVVVPLGVISIYFIIIQPIVIGTWCTLCLLAALAMLVMIPYTLDELVAMGQYLVQAHRRGEPFWRTFFRGGASPGSASDGHDPFDAPIGQVVAAAWRGATLPWTLVAAALLGVSLMFTRLLWGTSGPLADSDHLVGALVLTIAVMAMGEVGRLLRYLNVPLGGWLMLAPWVLEGGSTVAAVAGSLIGLAVVGLSLPRGARSDAHYGSWDRYVL